MRDIADLCLLNVLVTSKLWGRNWHGWDVDGIGKPTSPMVGYFNSSLSHRYHIIMEDGPVVPVGTCLGYRH